MDRNDADLLLEDAAKLVVVHNNPSASFIQRKLSIGYARAARIIDQLQYMGIITGANGAIPRRLLVKDLEKVSQLIKPRKLSPDELQDKVRELEIKVNKIMEAFKIVSYEPELPFQTPKGEIEEKDPLYHDALALSKETKGQLKASTLQRKFSIGYARAARILDELKKK